MGAHDLRGMRSDDMQTPTPPPMRTSSGGARTVVRRIILFVILFALVVVAAIGLSGLLERIVGADRVLAGDDAGPRSLARLHPHRRAAGRGAVVVAATAGSDGCRRAGIARVGAVPHRDVADRRSSRRPSRSRRWRPRASTAIGGPARSSAGVVWAGVWVWHRHMRRSAATAPTRLARSARELVRPLRARRRGCPARSARSPPSSPRRCDGRVLVSSQNWLVPVLQALVWCGIGALVWWWHWFRERGGTAPGAFAAVLLVIVVGAAAATTLFSLGTVLFVLLRLLFDSDPSPRCSPRSTPRSPPR